MVQTLTKWLHPLDLTIDALIREHCCRDAWRMGNVTHDDDDDDDDDDDADIQLYTDNHK